MFFVRLLRCRVFNAQNKFESGTGWPSFDRPSSARAIAREMDYGGGRPGVPGEPAALAGLTWDTFSMTDWLVAVLRFCINSAAIKLETPERRNHPNEDGRNHSGGTA